MIIKRCKNFFEKLVLKERSPRVLALSFCFGVFVAFSPFVCFHTIMILVCCWLFSMNLAVCLASTWLVNNPWTMIPVYWTNYIFGDWFLTKFFKLDPLTLNPSWMGYINNFMCKYTGLAGISFWSFMIGGNLLGLAISVMMYPVVKLIFKRISRQIYTKSRCKVEVDENYSQKQKSIS